MKGVVWIKELIKRGRKGANEFPHPRVFPVYRLCSKELSRVLFCWESSVAGWDGKQCSSAGHQGGDGEGWAWGLLEPHSKPCVQTRLHPHSWNAGVGAAQGNTTGTPRPRSVSSVGYPKLHPEHIQGNRLKGNRFSLYLVWDFVYLLLP